MKIKSRAFNIVIYPTEGISKKAINVSKKLKKKGSLFALDGKNYFPHITLYMTEFPLKNVMKIRKLLERFVSKMKPFRMKSLNYKQDKDGWIDVGYRKSKNIAELQRKIIKLLNPLREGLIRGNDKARMRNLSKAMRRNVKFYGYRNVGKEFSPHLTFTRLGKFNKSALSGIKRSDLSFRASRIGFFYLGDYGTCRKLIGVFDLS